MPGEGYGCACGDVRAAGGEAGDLRCGAGRITGVGVEGRDLDDFEVGGFDVAEVVEVVVIPTIVWRSAEVHGGAVIGHDEAIGFHGLEDDLVCGGVGGNVESGFEAQAHAHGWSVGGGGGASGMRSRRSEGGTGILHGEAYGVTNGARGDFVIANQAGKNGEAGGVGAGPGIGALLVGDKIPDGAGSGVPCGGLRIGTIEFVEEASVVVENEDVAIAVAGIGIAFDGRGERNGHGACVAFAAVSGVIHGNEGLSGVDHGVGNADGRAVVLTGAEIRMKTDGSADEIDDGGRVGIDGRGRNIFVPQAIGWEREEAVEAGGLAGGHGAAGGVLRGTVDGEILRGRGTAAGIGILHGHGESAGRGGVAGGGELGGRDERGGEGASVEEDLRAGNEIATGDGEGVGAEIGGGGRDAGEDGSGIPEGNGAGAGFRGVGGAGGLHGEGIGGGESGRGDVMAGGVNGAEGGGAARDVVDGPGDGGVGGAGDGGGEGEGSGGADVGGEGRDGYRYGRRRWWRRSFGAGGDGAAGGKSEGGRQEKGCKEEATHR